MTPTCQNTNPRLARGSLGKSRLKTLMPAGLQKSTLIDYPGKIACVIFLSGCNFHCPFCHNPDLARGLYPAPIALQDLLAFLNERRKFLDGVVISGGEPTLSPHLPDLCRMIRELDLSIKLDTNGSRPDTLAALIRDRLIDYLAMDIKTAPRQYAGLAADPQIEALIRRSIRLIMDQAPAYEFRTTCVQPFIDEAILSEIGPLIQGASLYVLQTFQMGNLLDPAYGSISGRGYAPLQMTRLQQIASPWVRCCRIR